MVTLFNGSVKRMFVVALVVLIGCKDSDKNSSLIFEELNESLERSNKIIANSSTVILEFFKSKVEDPITTDRATIWLAVADSIRSEAQSLVSFIDALKSNLKQNKIDIGPLTSDNLYKKLLLFKESVLKRNLYLKSGSKLDIDILGKEIKSDKDFYKINFLNKDVSVKIAMLSKVENNILVVANNMMSFCNGQVSGLNRRSYEMFQPVALINSTKFGKGEELTITAGLGEFVSRRNLSFEINGLTVQPNENGVGEYKMKIKNEPGNYKVHVKIKYTRPDGRENSLEKDIKYEVIE